MFVPFHDFFSRHTFKESIENIKPSLKIVMFSGINHTKTRNKANCGQV